MIDLQRKNNLTAAESLRICSAMQIIVLDELFLATRWDCREAVFHGGTSLKVAHGSPRFSEDLDFMVAEASLQALPQVGDTVASGLRKRLVMAAPGSEVAFKAMPQRPGRDRMDVWDFRWSHPMRYGSARVKCEFYAVDPALLAVYRSTPFLPVQSGGDFRMTAAIPSADPVSLWGDKVKAISSRPAFKMRDAHDLGFLSAAFDASGSRPTDGELREAVSLSASIYGKTLQEVADGVAARLEDGTMARAAEYLADMGRWFDEKTMLAMSETRTLDGYWERTGIELRIGLGLSRAGTDGLVP